MDTSCFDNAVEAIVEKDPRFDPAAYRFVREALDFTQQLICKQNEGEIRHVTGQELLEGIREFAVQQFGPMTADVFEQWGVTRCADFGDIVFNLVEIEQLKKTDSDTREDFKNGYDFHETFRKPYLPSSKQDSDPIERESN